VDYRRAEGDTFRVTVPALPDQNIELRIGTQVQIEVDAKSGEARLAAGQVLGGGDPAAREAMRLAAGLGGSVTRPAAPPPTTFSSPDPSVGQPGPAFGQPGFSPVAPATTFSSPASAGSFSAGSSTGPGALGAFGETKSDRIARLEDQRDRGQITPEQFAAQRQQIQDEI
jgi:hypothetical protein